MASAVHEGLELEYSCTKFLYPGKKNLSDLSCSYKNTI